MDGWMDGWMDESTLDSSVEEGLCLPTQAIDCHGVSTCACTYGLMDG